MNINPTVRGLIPYRNTFKFSPWNVQDCKLNKETDLLKKLRVILKLNNEDTDFFVKGLLTAAYSFFEVKNELEKLGKDNFFLNYLAIEAPSIEGGKFVQPEDKILFSWKPRVLPSSTKFKFTYYTEDSVLFSDGVTEAIVPISIYRENCILLPKEFFNVYLPGCRFGIQPDEEWEEGKFVDITISPTEYPYDFVADLISKNRDAALLLNSFGLQDSFQSSPDVFYKCALFVLALVSATVTQ